MKDFKLTQSHDLAIENFDLQFVTGSEAIVQNVKQTLLMFKGEWFLDTQAGVPWIKEILGTKNSLSSIKAIILNAVTDVYGVEEVTNYEQTYDGTNRSLSISIEIQDIYNVTNNIQLTL